MGDPGSDAREMLGSKVRSAAQVRPAWEVPGECAVCLHSTQPPALDSPAGHCGCQHWVPRVPVPLCDSGGRHSFSAPQFPPWKVGITAPLPHPLHKLPGGLHGWGCRRRRQKESTWSVCPAAERTPPARARLAGRQAGGPPGVGQGWLLPGRLPGRTLGEGGPIPPDS